MCAMLDGGGRYRILRRLGSGGMAEVLEGVARGAAGFERRVALKRMLPSSAGSASQTGMFLDEARIASHLHHANIVSILDFGILDGLPFQVLEFVDGLDAHQLTARTPQTAPGVSPALGLFICAEVGHALEYAHQAQDVAGAPLGIVHRDVKPSNILVSWNGEVKLSDFGIAFARDRAERTVDGVTKGTPLFMAPEQLTRSRVDRRTDLFALGCVLHALLTGRSPLEEGRLMEVLAGRALTLPPGLEPDIAEIIRKATQPALTARYADAGEMTRALGEALARRLDVDPKSALRDWMGTLKPAPDSRPGPGRLDGLLNVEIVAQAGDHLFTTLASPPAGPTERVPRAFPRRAVAAAVGAGLALAGVSAWATYQALRSAPPPPAPVVAAPRMPEATPPSPPPPPPPLVAETPKPAPEQKHSSSRRLARHDTATEASDTGTVAFGGAGWVGAEIWLDGKRVGYAPKLLDVTVGKHSVDLVGTRGEHSGPGTVQVTTRDTGISPLHYPAHAGNP
jgi:serine/threonine protein kinase